MQPDANLASLASDLYLESRDLIVKSVVGVGHALASWPGLDPAGQVSIRTLVVHVAGFDNLVQAALAGADVTRLVLEPSWQARFGSGFARELRTISPDITVPEPPLLDQGQALLNEQTASMSAVLESGIDLSTKRAFPDHDDLFRSGVTQSVSAAWLALRVPMHDRYHRGHITHLKYDYQCLHSH